MNELNFSLAISLISNDSCERKLFLYIKSCERKIFPSNEENKYMITGKVLHSMFQLAIKEYFAIIEYYHFREKKSISESLEKVFSLIFNSWRKKLLKKVRLDLLSKGDFTEIIDQIQNQIPFLAELCATLIIKENNLLKIAAIDDEFNVSYEIIPGVLLTGKVDLVAYDYRRKSIKFIELKTGKPRSNPDRRQLQLYGEIFKKNYPSMNKIELELWNSKSGEKSKGFSKITKLRKYKGSKLDNFQNLLLRALRCTKAYQLPSEINFPGSDKICKYCTYCESVHELFPESKKKEKPKQTKGLFKFI